MSQTIIAAPGMDLFSLAAQYLNDATQWIRIAQANGLSDPIISVVGSLFIPDADPTLTGGIPQAQ